MQIRSMTSWLVNHLVRPSHPKALFVLLRLVILRVRNQQRLRLHKINCFNLAGSFLPAFFV
jgi:hypothetical protein